MIFLTVGTHFKGFDRLVRAVDELHGSSLISEGIIAQIGNGSYKPKYLKAVQFCSSEDFAHHVNNARVIISHAGFGTISSVVKLKKPVIVVPRKASLGEHFDDHQFATARALESEHKILVAYSTDDIIERLKEAEDFIPSEIHDDNKIVDTVRDFINDLIEKRRL